MNIKCITEISLETCNFELTCHCVETIRRSCWRYSSVWWVEKSERLFRAIARKLIWTCRSEYWNWSWKWCNCLNILLANLNWWDTLNNYLNLKYIAISNTNTCMQQSIIRSVTLNSTHWKYNVVSWNSISHLNIWIGL